MRGARWPASLLDNWSTLNSYQRGNLTIPALLLGSALTERGFTGHRQLDGVGLIHMGGRVYDAEIGRFLSADPFTGDSTNLQALNRYTYVENNPLSYTDPSGYFLKKLVKKIGNAIKRVVSAVVEFERELRRKVLRAVGSIEGLSSLISLALNFIPTCQGWCAMMLQGAYSAAMADANGGTIAQALKAGAIAFVRAGLEQRGGGATPFGNRGSDSPGMIFHLDTAAKSVGQDGAGSWFEEDFLPEIVARLRKMEKKAQAKIRNESSSAVPQENGFGAKDVASLGLGFTPAGTVLDFCIAARGKDCITGDKVSGFWRFAGIVPFVSELRKAGNVLDAALDVTGKVHGRLPRAQDLSSYGVEDLNRLRGELQISVQTRIQKTVEYGADYGHNARLVEEQQLIQSIDKHLKDR